MLTDWRTGTRASALADFHLSLSEFDGPFDLLLHLVEKQGFDITTLSLVGVTAQYLSYVEELGEAYTEATSEFLAIGSQLLLLKSRAFLPKSDQDPEEHYEAAALAERLRVYGAFRKIAHELDRLQEEDSPLFVRLAPHRIDPEVVADAGTVDELVAAIHEMLRPEQPAQHPVAIPTSRFSLPERIAAVRDRLKQTDRLEFSDLAAECHSRIEIVYTLLSVLHLVADREIAISQRKPFGPIQIEFVEDD